mgnify:FL=1
MVNKWNLKIRLTLTENYAASFRVLYVVTSRILMFRKIKRLISGFCRQENGNASAIVGLSIIPLIAMIGTGVDVARYAAIKTELQGAIDSGILAAAALNNARPADEVVTEYLERNLDERIVKASDVTVNVISEVTQTGKTVQITASYTVDTYFTGLFGVNTMDLEIVVGGTQEWQEIEISMVLDISGSMNSMNKIGRMRDAAEEFVNTVLTEEVRDLTNINIIPFGTHVHLPDDFNKFVDPARIDNNKDNDFTDGHRWMGCLNMDSTDYTSEPFLDGSLEPLPEFRDYSLCPQDRNEALFLNNDIDTLTAKIRDLRAGSSLSGATSIDEGTAIGLKSLNPGMRGDFSGAFGATRPTDYDSGTLKVIVIMSDGDMVKYYRPLSCWFFSWGCLHIPISNQEAETNLQTMCDHAIDDNILIYTVGFNVQKNSRADRVLSDCVATDENYFWVEGLDISAAFSEIAARINSVRLTY